MEEFVRKNPWLGLESYKEGEILYGRDDDIRDLSQCVLNDIDTLLYGKSGIGKSSILNAGILPAARRSGYLPVLIRLSHKEKHSYLYQINQAIFNAILHFPTSGLGTDVCITNGDQTLNETRSLIREVVPCKDTEAESFYEYFHRHTFHNLNGDRLKLLIIFDQFEEIFTLQDDVQKKKNFFTHLADLLNDIMPDELQQKVEISSDTQEEIIVGGESYFKNIFDDLNLGIENSLPEYVTDNDVHFVFTIREDFLSEFEYYSAAIPSLKQNRYGLRPINEEQAAQIILRPVPELIDKSVAKLIIEKITGKKDFKIDGVPEIEVDSAVLSLYLNRLYEAKEGKAITRELVEQKGGEIISDFYNDALSDISDSTIEYLEDMLLNGQGRRDNITVYDAINDGNISEQELDILCNKKKILRQFNYAGDLRIEYVHDILCPVVKDHKEERALLKLHEEERRKQEELQKQLLLEEETKRREIERKAAEEKERLEEETRQIKEKNRKRVISIISSVIAISLIVFLAWLKDYTENEKLYEEYYAEFENRNGWPVGIGQPLSEEERLRTPLYYKLSHKGNKNGNQHTDVEIMSSAKFLPNSCRLQKLEWAEDENNDIKAGEYNDILKEVTSVRYSSTEGSNEISKEELIDKDGNVLMTISYFHLSANDAWAQFYTSEGENMKIRDNGLDRVNLSWDSIGRIKSLMYYDAQGVPQDIVHNKDVKGYIWEYSDDKTFRYALNEYGLPTTGLTNNTIVTHKKDGVVEHRYLNSRKVGDESAQEVICRDGYSRHIHSNDSIYLFLPYSDVPYAIRHLKRNSLGQIIHIRTEGTESKFASNIIYEHENGLVKKEEFLDKDGAPFGESDETIYKREFTYNEVGDIVEEKRINKAKELAYHHKIDIKCENNDTIRFIETLDIRQSPKYVMQIDSIKPAYTSTTYYGENNVGLNKSILVGDDSLCVHKIITEPNVAPRNTIISNKYYAWVDNEVMPLPTLDEYGKAISYFKRIVEYDNVGNVISLKLEDVDGITIKSMMYFIQNGQQIGRAVKGIDGNAVRCNEWEEDGLLYYKYYYSKDFEGQYSGLTAVDEWEHRSSIYDKYYDEYKYVKWYKFKGKIVDVFKSLENFKQDIIDKSTEIFKTYNQVIFENDPEISNLEIPYIHVLSNKSKMYDNRDGVIDGDRIIAFENWHLGKSMKILKKEWNCSLGKQNIHITILRPDANSYIKKELVLESDINESSYIEYHSYRMTNTEKDYIKKHIIK